MKPRELVETVLVYASWLARHSLAAAALVLAGRGLALGIEAATPAEVTRPAGGRGRNERETELNPLDLSASPSRPSLEDLKKLEGIGVAAQSYDAKPTFEVRSIVVNFGPPRSEVYINGSPVGRTPYAGQVSCRLGDTFRVDVVPPKGLPIHKDMRCLNSEPAEFSAKPQGTDRAPRDAASSSKVR